MIMPDFREYKGRGNELLHSAKGSTWSKHKYVEKKVINGITRYIYNFKRETAYSGKKAVEATRRKVNHGAFKVAEKKLDEAKQNLKGVRLKTAGIIRAGKKNPAYAAAMVKLKNAELLLQKAQEVYDKAKSNFSTKY